jgi:hypothetical protein
MVPTAGRSTAEQGFSAETARILQSLPPPAVQPAAIPAAVQPEEEEVVALEQLRHPAPVLSLQWSPGSLQSGEASA